MDPRIRSGMDSPEEEPAFAPPGGKKVWYRSVEMPFVWLGAGLVMVLILFLLFFPGRSSEPVFSTGSIEPTDLAGISDRLDKLASSVESMRMQRMFSEPGPGDQEELLTAIRKLNADLSMQIAALSKKMDGLEAPAVSAVSAPQKVRPTAGSTERPSVTESQAPLKSRTTQTPSSADVTEYRIQQGDTLYSIALKHKVPLAKLLEANNMTANDPIHPGQRLKIP
ncbi:LysM peptidoglycan-binding domain-containing protein [Desulfobotulus sp. H1]|uniref:LysM peptidoglycan-binding domain-containing protein n=1 Tax=Desulfobotulus pelophilus TaxID=2823377 RepID=A0ABT3N8F3_9BACT|nr:LysM domain-containing protein [Desulfobotulus pelophilus]MCW7753727.1 LysM peptidoglycan-binding domain-containing protein [Desulfobotulus pelophilus]